MTLTFTGRAGDSAPEPFAAFLAHAESRVREPIRGWQMRRCASDLIDDPSQLRAEIRKCLEEVVAGGLWPGRTGDQVRSVFVPAADLPTHTQQELGLDEDAAALVIFQVDTTCGGTLELCHQVQEAIARRRDRQRQAHSEGPPAERD